MPASGLLVVVAAGGTGGHLFPAEALSLALARRGATVDLATDERATRYGMRFPARRTHVIPSATPRGTPLAMMRAALALTRGSMLAFRLFARLQPAAVVGFGGYPTVPPLVAAALRRVPALIHEQNGVMGRANRLLAPFVDAIATGFPNLLDGRLAAKATHTGNPVRPIVIEAAKTPFPSHGDTLHLLVFGGSQGARIMAEIMPSAIELLAADVRRRLVIAQQAREEDIARVSDGYARLGVPAEVAAFFSDLPARMARSHLIVSRSGASTVAELATIGRPAILVPLPHALDQDQRANAGMLDRAGGAICIEQPAFTPARLAAEIARLAGAPDRLAAMAAAARACGAPDAADRLAELVLRVAGLKC